MNAVTGQPIHDIEWVSSGKKTVGRKAVTGQPIHDIEWVSSGKKTVGRKALTGQPVMTVKMLWQDEWKESRDKTAWDDSECLCFSQLPGELEGKL